MNHPRITKRQRRVLHASRMASRFAKTIAKQVEASLKKGTR